MAFEIGIIFGFIAVAIFFAFLVSNTEEETIFADIVRYIFNVAILLILVVSLNTSHVMATDNGASTTIISTLKTGYIVGLWIFFLTIIYLTAMLGISIYKRRTIMREEDDE